MQSHVKQTKHYGSLMWVLPVTVSVWIGVLVDGWFAKPSVRNPMLFVVDPILEVMVGPALALLLGWCLMTPARVVIRLQALLFVLISTLPIAYLAHQRPGQPWLPVWETAQYYTERYYSVGTTGFQLHEAVLVVLIAAWILLLLNRLLSQICFQRVPLESSTGGKGLQQRRSEAFWSRFDSDSEKEANRKWEIQVLMLGALLLLSVGFTYWLMSGGLKFDSLLKTALLFGCAIYLCVWAASECYRPWCSFSILLLGVVGLASLPQMVRIASTSFRLLSTTETLLICTFSIALSAIFGAGSLLLLVRTHQMPRRTKRSPWSTVATPTTTQAARKTAPPLSFWAIGTALGVLCGAAAYWLPQNIDPADLTDERQLSLRDGWLSARLLQKTNGARSNFTITRDQTTGRPTVFLKLPAAEESWTSTIALVEQRAKEGDQCSLEIESPVSDIRWLEGMLERGIEVTCSLDAGGHELPTTLIANPRLRLRRVLNSDLSLTNWSLLKASHPYPFLEEIVGCAMPDSLPPPIGAPGRDPNVLRECMISEALLAKINSVTRWRNAGITLIDPQWQSSLDGLTLTKYVYNEELLGQPPLSIPATTGFRPLIVPAYANEAYSRWEVSIRPLLLDPEFAAQVKAQPINLPQHLVFDEAGRLTEVGVTPTRDCPAGIPWTTLPDVEHLYVNLVAASYDARISSADPQVVEEVGFQTTAFPKLSRATIYSSPVVYFSLPAVDRQVGLYEQWDVRYEKFLRELLRHPGLREVDLKCRFNAKLWGVLAESEFVERLVVYPADAPEQPWLAILHRFSNLKEIVIHSRQSPQPTSLQPNQARLVEMQNYMAQLLGGPIAPKPPAVNVPVPEVLEGEALDRALAENQKMMEVEWTALIQSVVPSVRVKVVTSTAKLSGGNRWP